MAWLERRNNNTLCSAWLLAGLEHRKSITATRCCVGDTTELIVEAAEDLVKSEEQSKSHLLDGVCGWEGSNWAASQGNPSGTAQDSWPSATDLLVTKIVLLSLKMMYSSQGWINQYFGHCHMPIWTLSHANSTSNRPLQRDLMPTHFQKIFQLYFFVRCWSRLGL